MTRIDLKEFGEQMYYYGREAGLLQSCNYLVSHSDLDAETALALVEAIRELPADYLKGEVVQ